MNKYLYKTTMLVLLLTGVHLAMAQEIKKKTETGKSERKHKNINTRTHINTHLNSREIIAEFACNADATVYLENRLRRVDIRTSTDNKVKLVTTVYYEGDLNLTDTRWLQKLQLGISGTARNTVVKIGSLETESINRKLDNSKNLLLVDNKENMLLLSGAGKQKKVILPDTDRLKEDTLISNAIPIFDSLGNWVNRKSSLKQNITLYVPAGARLDIESKYADISISDNIKEIKARISNGGLTMMDAEKLTLTSFYGSVHGGIISNADIDITNGRIAIKTIKNLRIGSKNSTVELGTAKQITMTSNADEYEIDETDNISGEKNYGALRITVLNDSLVLSGINADIKVRDIEQTVRLVKITNQYADMRLPVSNLRNYTVSFEGTGGNVYSSFEKTDITASSFKANAGNSTGPSTLFELKCSNCTTDFK